MSELIRNFQFYRGGDDAFHQGCADACNRAISYLQVLKETAVEGFVKQGRGFVRFEAGAYDRNIFSYLTQDECEHFRHEENVRQLKELVSRYDPETEFVLYLDAEWESGRKHLDPWLESLSDSVVM